MNCEDTQRAIEASNFGTGTLALSALCQAHLSQCRQCQDYAKEYALPDILRAVTQTSIPDGLEARILGSVQAKTSTPKPLTWMMSAAATVLLAVTLVVFNLVGTHDPILTDIQVSVEEIQSVKVLMTSDQALENAKVRISVSDNIAVSGFENLRELNWQTSLKQGNNLLVLPIQLLQPSDGKIEVVLEHDGASKSYVIKVTPKAKVPVKEPISV